MSSRRWIEGLWTATMFLVLIAGCSSSQGHPTSDGDQEGESACPVGTKNCPCDAGDRCQEGLTCTEGYCLESPACTLGTESCSCLAGDRCNDGLVCTDGICIDESCPAGTQGCACIYNNLCNANLECLDQLCVPSGCTPGSLNCVCDDHQCQEGLECKENLCRSAAGGARLKIGNSSVRSCNLILLKGSGTAAGVSFADAVLGRIRVQSDRIGISLSLIHI